MQNYFSKQIHLFPSTKSQRKKSPKLICRYTVSQAWRRNSDMRIWSRHGCIVASTSAIIFFLSLSATAQENEDESHFDYRKGSSKGPGKWGELKEEWAVCKNGTRQSPINIPARRLRVTQDSGSLTAAHRASNATLVNRGHDIAITWEGDAGSININGIEYHLLQCHWHSPSEHTINGRKFDLELHMVHQSSYPNDKNRTLVLSFLFQMGLFPDWFLSQITFDIKEMIFAGKKEKKLGLVNPSQISRALRGYYKYMGSFTIPPCTEGVTWIINQQIMPVTWYQVLLLRVAVHDHARSNARPVQRLHGRPMQLYRRRRGPNI